HRGYDKQTERDIAAGAFLSNFAPLERSDAQAIMSDTMGAWEYSEPMRELIRSVADGEHEERYFVSSAHPRIVDGARTKNPRYLPGRPGQPPRREGARGAARPAQRRRRRRGPAKQPGRGEHPAPLRLRPAAPHGAAGADDGVHLVHDGQVALDDWRGLRGGDDQGSVQPAAVGL